MAELEIVLVVDLGNLTGDPAVAAQIFDLHAAAEAATRQVVADAGSDLAVKLRQSDLFRYRGVIKSNGNTGASTMSLEARLGSVAGQDVLTGAGGLGQLASQISEAVGAIDLPNGWTISPVEIRTRV